MVKSNKDYFFEGGACLFFLTSFFFFQRRTHPSIKFGRYSTMPMFKKGFPDSSVGKESACKTGDTGSIPGLGRSAGEEIGYPLQYSGLENSMDCIYSPWGRKESDTTERLSLSCTHKKGKHCFYKYLVILD